jgi:hypothetical protein
LAIEVIVMRRLDVRVAGALLVALLAPAMAHAQASISGLVQDTTGAVLPGVAVEATSPALIEKSRTAVTDSAGRYTIVDLRPGTYAVTFTLQGFTTVKREGIVLEGAATVQVNGDLRVGALEETLTVTGDAPIVDVQSVRREFVVNKDMMEALPVGRSLTAQVVLIPGVTGQNTAGGVLPTIHGSSSSETYMYNDGMRAGQHMIGAGIAQGGWSMSEAASAELTYQTGAQSAEYQVGGVAMNAIPKEGGNTFAGTWVTYGAGGGVQSDNRTEELKAVIRDANRLIYTIDLDGAFGGPIIKNKLWFFGGGRRTRSKSYVADVYYPDGSQAFSGPHRGDDQMLRLTSQLTPRNKLRVSFDKHIQRNFNASVGPGVLGSVSGGVAPEASYDIHIPQVYAPQARWTSPVTNRLFLEAGFSTHYMHWRHQYNPVVGPLDVANSEATTGYLTIATNSRADNLSNQYNAIASLSYVTGSHNFKTGFVHRQGYMEHFAPYNGDMQTLSFVNGVPNSVTVLNTPMFERDNLNADSGIYAQDRWTLKQLTVNLGVRYDHFNVSIPPVTAPAGRFVPARSFPEIKNRPNWNDWAIRTGVAYDLFGDGRTAIKGNVSRYVAGESLSSTTPYNPMALKSESRSWRDLDGNRRALDAFGNAQYNEIGPARNVNFGLDTGTTRPDPDLPRGYNWEESAVLQHELRPGLGVSVGYYWRQYYNLTWTDNLLVDPDGDYTPFTIIGPHDSRLPNGGGEVITLYNLNPNRLGLVDNVVKVNPTRLSSYGGLEVTAAGRLKNGAFFQGGLTTERTTTFNCDVDNPNSRRFCDVTPPFRYMWKASGSYPLPYGFAASGVWRILPGSSLGATYTVTSAIAGVPLTGGGSLSVQLVEPSTVFAEDQQQLDMRLMKIFRFGRLRVQGLLDIYNILNASTATTINQSFGANWLKPQAIMQARYLRFGTQIDF